MITKYDLMMIEFDRDGKNWTIMQRSKHYSVSRMVLRDRPQSVKFMLIVTDPPNVSTREIIKISREFTEITALSYGARVPLESVPCPGWPQHMKSNPTKPPVLPTPRRENKTLIVETDENGTEVDVDRNDGTVEKAGDEPAKEEPAVQLDEAPLDETQLDGAVASRRPHLVSSAARAGTTPVRERSQTSIPMCPSSISKSSTSLTLQCFLGNPHGNGRTAGLQPAVTCAAAVPVIEYVSPVFAVYAATVPVNECAAPALLICRRVR